MLKTIPLLFLTLNLQANLLVDEVKVFKTKHRLELLYHGQVTKIYNVMIGRGGLNPKREQGDLLVPEGNYILDDKNDDSKFHRSIHISYPNKDDLARASKDGINPGGDVFIHGLPNTKSHFIDTLREELVKIKDINKIKEIQKKLDWTAGCVAVSDQEIEEIFESITVPIPITIYH